MDKGGYRGHQVAEQGSSDLPKGPCLGVEAVLEPFRLTDQVCPAAQPALETAVNGIAIAHQPVHKAGAKHVYVRVTLSVVNLTVRQLIPPLFKARGGIDFKWMATGIVIFFLWTEIISFKGNRLSVLEAPAWSPRWIVLSDLSLIHI